MRFIALLLLALVPLFAPAASAQDIPGRVGRVSFTEGPVAIYQDPEIGWEKAYVNSPLTSENSLWTEPESRAEMRVSAVAVRLDGATQVDFTRLDDDELHASVVRGSVGIRVRHNDYRSRFVFDTPEARFSFTREGTYRVDVDPEAGESRLVVFSGEAFMETAQGRRPIQAGRTVRVFGGDYVFERAFTTDFDRWAQARDGRWVERSSVRYVSTYMTGYEELDPYGDWIQDPAYGALWVPTRVAADWVPYRYGHWSYLRPWGWTWIDDQPWGYAPFHYGRWVNVRDRWCWYPGRREARPTWAPALVAWVGGSNWSVGVRSDSPMMGWYPLAPNERYRPMYRASDAYVNRVNNIVISNTTINQYYGSRPPQEMNRTVAVTAMPREQMIERRPVQQAMVRIAPDVARSAQVMQQAQAVMPNNQEIQRMRAARAQTAPPSVAAMPAAQREQRAAPAQAPAQAPAGNAAISRGQRPGQPSAAAPPITAPQVAPGAPAAPVLRPNFARPQAAPAPAPAPANVAPPPIARQPAGVQGRAAPATPATPAVPSGQGPATPAQPAQPAQPAPQANPLSRDRGAQGQERQQQEAQRVQQQQQQEAQRRTSEAQRGQQQQQQEAQRVQQQQQQEAQRRAAEAQRGQQQQQEAQRVQQQQQEAQRRAAEAQRAQQQQQQEAQRVQQQQQQEAQRRAAETQRAQQQQQEAQRVQQQQQQEAQRRAAEAQRAQQQQQEAQRVQQQQQQEAQRRAAEAQRAQQQQQEAQRRAAEAQRAKPAPQAAPQAAPPAAPQAAPQPAPQAAPQAAPPANPAARGGERRATPPGKAPDEDEKPGRGKGRPSEGG